MNKKLFYALLFTAAAAVVTVAALIIIKLTATGADTPELAAWGYQKAATLRDAEGMMKYSSEYNKAVLERVNPTDGKLVDYLKRLYAEAPGDYKEAGLTCRSSELVYYQKGSDRYDELLDVYRTLVPLGEAEEFCALTLTISYEGRLLLTYPALTVKTNGRWYFFKLNDYD
ncbi:MAG: hypothetical protein PHW77_06645 [Eubacteriales bacterium]|nr:hypothetical protein [Eubacteriales bacterium]